ncbi:MAG: translation initiation factor IF-3 [Pseudomonadota bacterium]|uniref:translation initiation factor IF-3 n=1 Tax=Abyssibacter sp. TaxID=2320200 RepID=UPI002EC1C202|nr:translation initiation factor IF-3 [Pseudomonadota bacterium]
MYDAGKGVGNWFCLEDEGIARERQDRRNDQITVPKVRLVDADGEQVGIVSIEDALSKAADAGLDLVEVAPQADPPVCRIMDYGKHIFEKQKSQQNSRKKQKQIQVKEVKFRPGTDEGDYKTKLRNLKRFLEDGDKIKVTLRFRGREMAHQEIGMRLLDRVREELEEMASVEQRPKMEGRQLIMVMAPRKN